MCVAAGRPGALNSALALIGIPHDVVALQTSPLELISQALGATPVMFRRRLSASLHYPTINHQGGAECSIQSRTTTWR